MRVSMALCLAALLAATGFRASAQTESSPTPRPTPPPGPLLKIAPDFAAWTIIHYTIQGLGSQSAEAVIGSVSARNKSDSVTVVTKTGPVRHRLRKLNTGQQEDIWFEHGNRVTMQSEWKIPIFERVTSGRELPQGPDFPELAWISDKNFVGMQTAQDASYLVFETQVTEGNERLAKEHGDKLNSTFNRAFINADTRMPWLLQTGNALQRYAFQAAPTAVLDVPTEYQILFDTYEKKKAEPATRRVAP